MTEIPCRPTVRCCRHCQLPYPIRKGVVSKHVSGGYCGPQCRAAAEAAAVASAKRRDLRETAKSLWIHVDDLFDTDVVVKTKSEFFDELREDDTIVMGINDR